MKKIVLILTYFIVVQPSLLLAQGNNTKAPPKLPQTTEQQSDKTDLQAQEPITSDKKDWLADVEKTLPGLLCDPKQYFVECFNVSQKECTEFTHLLVRACLNNIQLAIPPMLDKHQGEYWGKMVGKCSYDLYEKFMQSKKLPKPGCDYFPPSKDNLPKPGQEKP